MKLNPLLLILLALFCIFLYETYVVSSGGSGGSNVCNGCPIDDFINNMTGGGDDVANCQKDGVGSCINPATCIGYDDAINSEVYFYCVGTKLYDGCGELIQDCGALYQYYCYKGVGEAYCRADSVATTGI